MRLSIKSDHKSDCLVFRIQSRKDPELLQIYRSQKLYLLAVLHICVLHPWPTIHRVKNFNLEDLEDTDLEFSQWKQRRKENVDRKRKVQDDDDDDRGRTRRRKAFCGRSLSLSPRPPSFSRRCHGQIPRLGPLSPSPSPARCPPLPKDVPIRAAKNGLPQRMKCKREFSEPLLYSQWLEIQQRSDVCGLPSDMAKALKMSSPLLPDGH